MSPLFERLRDGFAVLGILLVIALTWFYWVGREAVGDLDPKAAAVLTEFARQALATDIASASVIRMPVAEGVSLKESIESMKLRANKRNIKLVSRFALHKEAEARTGERRRHVEIFQFCDAGVALELIDYNPDFVAHMPCRIALYEDAAGQAWLVTVNLELLLHGGRDIDPGLKQAVVGIKDGLVDIMAAGASGDL